MLLTPIAIVSGLVVGLLRGGQPKNLRFLGLRWIPLLVLGLVVQTVGDQVSGIGGPNVFMIGSFILIVALGRNLHLKGMTIVSIGLLLNLTVLVFNGHVPVRFDSLVSVGHVDPTTTAPKDVLGIGAVGEIETSQTSLAFLGDIVPVPVLNQVISFGDLIMIAGLLVLSMNLLLLPRRSGISIEEILDETVPSLGPDHDLPGTDPIGLDREPPGEDSATEGVLVLPRRASEPVIDLTSPAPQVTSAQSLPARPSFEAALRVPPRSPDSNTRSDSTE